MTTKTLVRRIGASEGEVLRSIRLAALCESPHAFGAKLADEEAKPISEFIVTAQRHAESETSTTFLAFSGNEPVGQVGAFFDGCEGGRPFICALWVAPQMRRRKVGVTLVLEAVCWLQTRDARSVFAWVADGNESARRFYSSFGFTATSERQRLPSNPTEWETLLELRT